MLLEKLSNAIGVSGEENAVRKIILEAIKDHVTDIRIDSIGNLTALKKGTGKSPVKVGKGVMQGVVIWTPIHMNRDTPNILAPPGLDSIVKTTCPN